MPKNLELQKKRTYSFKNKLFGLILVVLSLFFLIGLPAEKQKQEKNSIVIDKALYSSVKNPENPIQIIIPNIGIDLPVTEAKIVQGYWEVSENTASHGEGSGYPGEAGNIVIFAHAKKGLFYNLKDIKTGDFIYVLTPKKWYSYKVKKITSVYPNQVETIMPTKKETLTLYTCTGFFDEKRLIVVAMPSK